MSQINMFGVFIEKANLKRVRMEESRFIECTFEEVNMREAIIKNNLWGDTTLLANTNLRGAIWEEIDGYPLRRYAIMPNGDIVTDMIKLPDGTKISP
ncbi:MAG: pentapeptide repeat-containing protein [Cyanobacteria bacterium P01_A01_bin.83]